MTEAVGYSSPLTAMTDADRQLAETFTTYQMSRAFSPSTVNRRRLSLNRFATHMAPASITTATAADIDEFTAKQRAAATANAYRSDLSVFFRWAVRRGLVANNPVLGTDSVRRPKALPKPAKAEWITATFTVASAELQLALLLGALAGLRISEVVALDANNVHLDAEPPVLVVRDGKWGKDRIVPLHPRLIPMLRGQSGWFFPNGQGGHIKPAAIHNMLQHLLVRNGIPRFTFHALRHYFGSEAARWSGGNVVLVAALMGHENTNTTMGYIGWAPTEGAEVVAKITGGGEDELTRRRHARTA